MREGGREGEREGDRGREGEKETEGGRVRARSRPSLTHTRRPARGRPRPRRSRRGPPTRARPAPGRHVAVARWCMRALHGLCTSVQPRGRRPPACASPIPLEEAGLPSRTADRVTRTVGNEAERVPCLPAQSM